VLDHIKTLTLRATYEAQENGRLPAYLGSTIRGVIGHRLRAFVCRYPKLPCHRCRLADDCPYALHFCSPGHAAGSVNPYVIRPLVRDKLEWQEGDRLQFDITLIGRTADAAGLFIDALQDDARQGWGASRLRFRLQQIIDPVRQTLIWNAGKTWLRNCRPQPLRIAGRRAQAAIVRFESPVRLLVNRELRCPISFADLIESLARRLALLSHAYTGHRLEWSPEMFAEAQKIRTAAEQWRPVDFQRYSMNRPDKLSLPAVEGWARYEGELTPFTPILAAGEQLHVGKNATIGFGQLSISYDQ
jgi:hypothetical protein